MLLVGFEPTIPAFERLKTVHALDRAATVISFSGLHAPKIPAQNSDVRMKVRNERQLLFALEIMPAAVK
jgi:hypothetical protein